MNFTHDRRNQIGNNVFSLAFLVNRLIHFGEHFFNRMLLLLFISFIGLRFFAERKRCTDRAFVFKHVHVLHSVREMKLLGRPLFKDNRFFRV